MNTLQVFQKPYNNIIVIKKQQAYSIAKHNSNIFIFFYNHIRKHSEKHSHLHLSIYKILDNVSQFSDFKLKQTIAHL